MTIFSSAGAKRRRIAPFLAFSATVHRHEAVRAAIRAALATGLTYLVCTLLAVPDKTWAVISALYVLQTSVGGTVNVALGRVMGAAVGIVLGLAGVILIGSSEWLNLLALLLAIGIMGAVGEFRPQMRFGAVVAAILIISPSGGGDLLGEAIEKAYAISVGCGIGALVGAFVFPVTAHQSARNHLCEAVRRCGDLIALAFDPNPHCGNEKWSQHHDAVARELTTARERLGQSRWLKRFGNDQHGQMLHAVDRLWHHLSMFDRMVSGGDRHPGEEQQELLTRSRKASCAYMGQLAGAIAGDGPDQSALDQIRQDLEDVSRSWDAFLERRPADQFTPQDKQREIVAFGWRQLRREMDHLAESVGLAEKAEDDCTK